MSSATGRAASVVLPPSSSVTMVHLPLASTASLKPSQRSTQEEADS